MFSVRKNDSNEKFILVTVTLEKPSLEKLSGGCCRDEGLTCFSGCCSVLCQLGCDTQTAAFVCFILSFKHYQTVCRDRNFSGKLNQSIWITKNIWCGYLGNLPVFVLSRTTLNFVNESEYVCKCAEPYLFSVCHLIQTYWVTVHSSWIRYWFFSVATDWRRFTFTRAHRHFFTLLCYQRYFSSCCHSSRIACNVSGAGVPILTNHWPSITIERSMLQS